MTFVDFRFLLELGLAFAVSPASAAHGSSKTQAGCGLRASPCATMRHKLRIRLAVTSMYRLTSEAAILKSFLKTSKELLNARFA